MRAGQFALPKNPDLVRRLNEVDGLGVEEHLGRTSLRQRDIALKARRPFFTNSLCICMCAAAQGVKLGFSELESRSTILRWRRTRTVES
jgi:hypothetical protein